MKLAVYFFASFFLGAIPTAYCAGRFLKNIDIRQHGSGNVGATNAFRVLGKGPGVFVFAVDFLKGAVPVMLFSHFFPRVDDPELMRLIAGLFAVLGHLFTPFLAFKGGKGIATGGGALCAVFPYLFLLTLGAWLLTFFISRIVSLSSLVAVFVLAVSAVLTVQDNALKSVFIAMALLVFWTHRSNIGKLMRGEEHKFVNRQNS